MLGSTGNKCIHRITTTLDLSQLKNKVPQALWHGACGASIGGVPGGRPRCRPRSEFISIELICRPSIFCSPYSTLQRLIAPLGR